jgi:hypothetical protein
MLLAAMAAGPAYAQEDCGNGSYCPKGQACLTDGTCARILQAPPGGVRTANGQWCDRGFREHRYLPNTCSPESYIDCRGGYMCPSGQTCNEARQSCEGGPPPTGPMCNGAQCDAGRVCASNGHCMNTTYFKDCGNGTICPKGRDCRLPQGCVSASAERTLQKPWRR